MNDVTPLERAAAIFLTRTMLGFVYLFAGVHKLLDPGVLEFGRQWAVSQASQLLPGALLMAVGTLTPFIELVLGGLLLMGLWTRPVLRCLVVLIVGIAVAYGVAGLMRPMGPTAMDITVVNFYILPRAALVVLNLFLSVEDDRFSIDGLMRNPG